MIISQEKNKSKSTSTSNEDSEIEIKKNKGNMKGIEKLNGINVISKGNNVNQRVINKEFFEEQMQKIGSGEVNNQKDRKNVNINKYSNKENVPINSYIPTVNKVEIKSSIFKPKKIEFKDYYRLENDSLLKNYGSDIFRKIKLQEKDQLHSYILANHSLSSELRTKMVDWIMEVYSVFDFSTTTYFTTVHILDTYLIYTKKEVTDADIHLLGMVCMFIATKFEESNPLRIEFLWDKIGHKTFSKEEILAKEKEVLKGMGIENITNTSTLECITCFLYDFGQNNDEFLTKHNLYAFMDHLKWNAIYFAELLLHFEKFNGYQSIYKGLGCILLAFDQIKVETYKLGQEEEFYIREWIKFVLKENPYDLPYDHLYKQICQALEKYNSLDYIGFNINTSYKKEVDKLKELSEHRDCKACLRKPKSSSSK